MEQNDSAEKSQHELDNEFLADPVKRVYGVEGMGVDSHLQDLVKMVNASSSGLTFGITLFTPAGVITGNLIGHKAYFEKFGQSFQAGFEKAFPNENWDVVGKNFALKGAQPVDEPGGEYPVPPQFIHLEKATLLKDSGDHLTKGGTLWRGKIQSVSGFVLGLFN